jgi:hypothetical protein
VGSFNVTLQNALNTNFAPMATVGLNASVLIISARLTTTTNVRVDLRNYAGTAFDAEFSFAMVGKA